jgi:hypothetical protein
MCIQRDACLAIPARTRQEGKMQNAKASKQKKTRHGQSFVCVLVIMFSNHGSIMKSMIGS